MIIPSLLVSLLFSMVSWAGTTPFQIINRTSALNPDDPIQGPIYEALNQAADTIEATVNNGILSEASRQTFVNAVAKANTSGSSALVMDRGSEVEKMSFGLGGQGSVYTESGSLSFDSNTLKADNTLPGVGVSGYVSAMVGVNAASIGIKKLGPLDPKRLNLYAAGGAFKQTTASIQISLLSLGAGMQYQLITPKIRSPWLGWGGLYCGLGGYLLTNSVSFSAKLQQQSSVAVATETAIVNIDMNYSLGVETTNVLLPLEVSSHVRFLYLFTLFGGVAGDFNFGSTKLKGSASGPVAASYSQDLGGGNLFSGTGSLNLDDGIHGKVDLFSARGFLGLQFNLWRLRVSTEVSVLTNGKKSAAALVRYAF